MTVGHYLAAFQFGLNTR